MTGKEKSVLESALAKLFKLGTEDVASLYNEAGELESLDTVIDSHKQFVERQKTERESQYNRGLKEGSKKFESHIKSSYGLDSDDIGTELVDKLVEKVKSESQTQKTSDEDVEKHPKFIALKADIDKKVKAAITEQESKFNEERTKIVREKLIGKAKQKALDILNSLNPIFPEDPARAEAWRKTYLKEIEGYDFSEKDEDLIPLSAGKIMEDEHGKTLTFADLAKRTADKYFDYKKAGERQSAGNKEGSSAFSVVIKNRDHYNELIRGAKSREERNIIIDAYSKQNAGK